MIKAEFFDRHSEHIDPDIPLCIHGQRQLDVKDKWICTAEIGGAAICEIELEVVGKDHIRVIVNHLDYLIAKKVAALATGLVKMEAT